MRRPWSVMDSPSTDDEAKQEAERVQREHDENQVFEATLAGTKGEGFPDNPFFGTSPADAKARRQSRGGYSQEDFQPQADWLDSYSGPRTRQDVHDMDELRDFVRYKMQLAREEYGDDFDTIINDHVLPQMREVGMDEFDPRVQEWLLTTDFCDDAYRHGLALNGRRPSEGEPLKSHSREIKHLGKIENLEDFVRGLDNLKLKW